MMNEGIELPPPGEQFLATVRERGLRPSQIWFQRFLVSERERQLLSALKRIAELEEVIRQLVIQKDIHKTRAEQAEEKIAKLEREKEAALGLVDGQSQLLAALTKISQLEQQILEIQGNAAIRFAEAEARWHRAETAINEAYEFAHDGFPTSCEERLEEYFFQPEGQDSAAEGGIGK